ncbi:putative inactive neutral ceramidase B [Halyomorpha halys]|uniref:putative inactive neutral ceramidase B n=1 Tax=Halyomorpha halys TaxID=286706 RepID=UPI0006D4F675|nr:putative inactive neutral ceramidase B [Halyomorpha halys]
MCVGRALWSSPKLINLQLGNSVGHEQNRTSLHGSEPLTGRDGTKPDPGPEPPESFSDVVSLLPPVLWDMPGWGKNFGDVISQPREEARAGETVSAVFVSGNPRNNFQNEGTYLTVEKLDNDDKWNIVATDANWETRFIWTRVSILGTSLAEVRWDIPPDAGPGTYRIRHYGHFKNILSRINPYEGVTTPFKVVQ